MESISDEIRMKKFSYKFTNLRNGRKTHGKNFTVKKKENVEFKDFNI